MRRWSLVALGAVIAMGGVSAPASPPLATYGRLPGLEMAAISPSGTYHAVVGTVGDTRRVVVLKGDTILLTVPVGDEKVRGIEWAGDDHLLVRSSAYMALGVGFSVANAELSQVAVVSIPARSQFIVFAKAEDVAHAVFGAYGVVRKGGHWFGYFGAHTLLRGGDSSERFWAQRGPDLYRVDLDTGATTHVADGAGSGMHRDWLIGPDGEVAASLDYVDRDGSWRIVAGQSHRTIATGTNPGGDAGLISLGRTAATLLYRQADADRLDHWIEVPLDGGPATEILRGDTMTASWIDPLTHRIIGYRHDADQPEDIFFDPLRERRMAAARKAFGLLNVTLIDADAAFDKLIVHTDGNDDAGTWWLVDLETGSARDIGFSYPAVRSADVGPMSVVSYKAADGTSLAGILTLPPGTTAAKSLPLVVMPHGGPGARDHPVFHWWAQAFASRGYAVFQPNFRGSTGYGVAFEKAGERQWGRTMQTDISDGVAALAAQGLVDPHRACIVGASYGGYAALAGVTLQHGLYRCAVAVAGVSDLPSLFDAKAEQAGHDATVLRDWQEAIGHGTDTARISPARLAAKADAPILLIHGRNDTVVPFAQSRLMQARLQAAGKPVELVELKGEDHWLSRSETREAMLAAAVAFVERHDPVGAAP